MKNGKRIILMRRITLSLIFVAVIASLAFDVGIGTPSAFGVGEFFLLCPLGGIEAMLADRSFLPSAALSLVVLVAFVLLFGRAWCAWGCPAPLIRAFFRRQPQKEEFAHSSTHAHDCLSCTPNKPLTISSTLSRLSQDRRLWVLVGVIILTLIVGFPLFCLVCPIGLTFGSVSSLWHLLVNKQVTASVIVFPIALVIELVIYRKWCVNLCPIGAFLGLFGKAARLFRPHVDASECLRYNTDKQCNVCIQVCAEDINLHTDDASQRLGECTRCGECVASCPAHAVTIEVKPGDTIIRK